MKRKLIGNHRPAHMAAEVIKRCPVMQKTCYPTRKTAKTAINGRRAAEPLYAYKCPDCHFWHLTKRPQPI